MWCLAEVVSGLPAWFGQPRVRRRGPGWPRATPEGLGLDAGVVCGTLVGAGRPAVTVRGSGRSRRQVPGRCRRGRAWGAAAGHPPCPQRRMDDWQPTPTTCPSGIGPEPGDATAPNLLPLPLVFRLQQACRTRRRRQGQAPPGWPAASLDPDAAPAAAQTKPEDQKQPQPGTTSRLDRLRSFMDDPEGDGVHTAIEESSAAACRLSAVSPLSPPVSQLRPGELP